MYRVELLPKVRKELARIPQAHQKRIALAVDMLSSDPFVGKRLEGRFHGAWSLRVWPYRILYVVHKNIVTVEVFHIGHRQGVYKK